MCIELGVEIPIVRELYLAYQNESDIHFFLDILTDHIFTIHFSDWLSLETHIFHETTTPFKS